MLTDESIVSLHSKLKSKQISSTDLLNECFAAIDTQNPKLNAFITQADRKELKKRAESTPLSHTLSGIPYVLKDAYLTKGLQTTAASNVLRGYIPQYDATLVEKLSQSGALLLGKTNQDAWGHGASSENSDFGPVKNPWDTTRVAGGSTGGVAAAISSGMSVFGIGEDTGGSIRNPAGWCGISGLKVTYGRVSRYGAIAYASSLDSMGPMAKSVEDLALILHTIAGVDAKDATSSPRTVPNYLTNLNSGIKGKVIGLPSEYFQEGIDPEIKRTILSAAKQFASLGGKIDESVSLPSLSYGVAIYYLLAPSETSSNLARYDGIRYGHDRSHFTTESIRRIMVGTFALSSGYYDAYYKRAQKARTLIIREYNQAFSKCDFILAPTSPTPPTKLGELISDPLKNMLADIFTVTVNTAGIPALVIPCGFTVSNLPIGIQLQGPMFSEELLFQAGHAYQQATNWHERHPNL